jgi:hypothetical protein
MVRLLSKIFIILLVIAGSCTPYSCPTYAQQINIFSDSIQLNVITPNYGFLYNFDNGEIQTYEVFPNMIQMYDMQDGVLNIGFDIPQSPILFQTND